MPNALRERRPQLAWAGSIAVVAAVAVLAVVLVITGNDDGDQAAQPESETTPSSVSTTPDPGGGAENDGGSSAPSGFVTLPRPGGEVQGYPTNYPRTPEGAAATAAAYTRAAAAIDFREAERAVRAYTSGVDVQDAADAMVQVNRDIMQLPLGGDPPLGASAETEIEGVKWREVEPGEVVDVSTQFRWSFVGENGGTDQFVGAGAPLRVVWSEDAWRVDGESYGDGPDEKYAEPGSETFADAGWLVIRNEDWTNGRLR